MHQPTRLRPLTLCVLSASLALAACEGPPEEGDLDPELEEGQSGLYLAPRITKWPNGRIPVCFSIKPTDGITGEPAREMERNKAREAVTAALRNGWQKAARIDFVFGDCTTPRRVNLVLRPVPNWHNIGGDAGLGVGSPNRVQVAYCDTNLNGLCFRGIDDSGNARVVDPMEMTRATALHEMGHALGFLHEHQRPDSPADLDRFCGDAGNRDNPNNAIVPDGKKSTPTYDRSSVMNYCRDQNNDRKPDGYRPWDTVNDRLSAGDQQGARAEYGKR